MALEHLRLADLSDREVLMAMLDLTDDPESYVNSDDVAKQLGMKGDRAKQCVAIRLSWMSRYGAVERELLYDENRNPIVTRAGDHKRGQGWRPTEVGEAIADGSLKANQERMLDGLTDAQLY